MNIRVVVGMATCGIAAGARPVLTAFVDEVGKRNLKNVTVTQTGCIGVCRLEPIVEVYVPGQEKVTYVKMTPEMVPADRGSSIWSISNVVTEYTIGAARIRRRCDMRSCTLPISWSAAAPAVPPPAAPSIIEAFEAAAEGTRPGQGGPGGQDRLLRPVRHGPHRDDLPRGRLLQPRSPPRTCPRSCRSISLKGRIVTAPALHETVTRTSTVTSLTDTQFYKQQLRIALRNCGVIDPENIDEYIAVDGYTALAQGPDRNDPRAGHRRASRPPACGAAAAPASPPA